MADFTPVSAYATFLVEKIALWTAARDTYLAAIAKDSPPSKSRIVSAVGTAAGSSSAHAHGEALPVGVFRDKSLKEAIPIYLGSKHGKQTNKEIAQGLQAGGFPTVADNFEATVATALYRLRNEGVVLRFPDGWDLASSYPDSLRGRLEKADAAPKKRMKAKRAKRSSAPQNETERRPKLTLKIKRKRTLSEMIAAAKAKEKENEAKNDLEAVG